MKPEELAHAFADPPAEYGPIDGWWWEAGHLDRDKMRWQLEEMKDKGISGTWFYSRYVYGEPLGSDPPYFSDAWWEFTRWAAEEQKRLGLINWFSNWTLLQFEQDAIRAQRDAEPALWGRRLALDTKAADAPGAISIELDPTDVVLDAAAYQMDGDDLDYITRVRLTGSVEDGSITWAAPGPDWKLAVVSAKRWDLDYLTPEVGRRWNDVILGAYERNLGELMGDSPSAFGPDEMLLLNGTAAFSSHLLDQVTERLGEDAAPYLIGMFCDIGPKTDAIRCTYYAVMNELLGEHFYDAPTEWLHGRGMQHVSLSQLGGDPLTRTFHYGDPFRYLSSFDIPGNEDPGGAPPGERRFHYSKLSSSVAHIKGKKRAILLAHYCSGWGHTLAENLAWTNEAYAKGLNLYSRHLGSYSLMGGWYEYVPPSDHWYHPYWRYWRTFADHVRRLSFVLSQGHHRPDVAVLYPLTTVHAHWRSAREDAPPRDPGDAELGDIFAAAAHEAWHGMEDAAKAIYFDAIDFDFVDDDALGSARVEGDVLDINGVRVRCVLLPPITTIRLATMRKIKEFHDAGGAAIAYGRLPTASAEGGRDDEELRSIVDDVFGITGRGVLVTGDADKVPTAISEAIARDVVASDPGIFQTHQHVGDADAYFLFNVHAEERTGTFTLRVDAEVERWDPATGEIRRLNATRRGDGTTEVTIRMAPNEGVVLVCSDSGTPDAVPEQKTGKQTGSHAIEGPFAFRLEPTMDNRWGDFRYPASDQVIGAEARRFRYAEENGRAGTDLGWHSREHDDSSWEEVTYSYGPYWLHLGPFEAGSEPSDLLERAKAGDRELAWEPYIFSKKFGYEKVVPRGGALGLTGIEHLLGVPENFLVFDRPEGVEGVLHRYVSTTVEAPDDGEFLFLLGCKRGHDFISGSSRLFGLSDAYDLPVGTQAWINGDEVISVTGPVGREARNKVHLRRGKNTVLLKLVQPEATLVEHYALLLGAEPANQKDPYIPLLSWFMESQDLVYEVKGDGDARIGWYRVTAPPGLREMKITAEAKAIEAWVDGEPLPVTDGTISLPAPKLETSVIALRVEQIPGTYAGAVFTEPIVFECDEGRIGLGDWSGAGLPTYSGIGVYSTEVSLDETRLEGGVVLDLGEVKTVADVSVNGKHAGVKIAPPFRVDITELVRAGSNTIEIKVANTLANHYSTYPTIWIFPGQTVSGLLGPVELSFMESERSRR